MALPKEIQDLLNYLEEWDPFELTSPHLSPHLLVETSCKWLKIALERSAKNPRLLSQVHDTAGELEKLAKQFRERKEKLPPP